MQNKTVFLFLIIFHTSCSFTMETYTDFYNNFCLGIFNLETTQKETLDDRGDKAKKEYDEELNEYVRTQRAKREAKREAKRQQITERRLSEAQEWSFQLQRRIKNKIKRKTRKKQAKKKKGIRRCRSV